MQTLGEVAFSWAPGLYGRLVEFILASWSLVKDLTIGAFKALRFLRNKLIELFTAKGDLREERILSAKLKS